MWFRSSTWGLGKGFMYCFCGEASNCWETLNMVIIRDRPFFSGGEQLSGT